MFSSTAISEGIILPSTPGFHSCGTMQSVSSWLRSVRAMPSRGPYELITVNIKDSRAMRTEMDIGFYMAVSISWGSFCGCPCTQTPIIWDLSQARLECPKPKMDMGCYPGFMLWSLGEPLHGIRMPWVCSNEPCQRSLGTPIRPNWARYSRIGP